MRREMASSFSDTPELRTGKSDSSLLPPGGIEGLGNGVQLEKQEPERPRGTHKGPPEQRFSVEFISTRPWTLASLLRLPEVVILRFET